MRKRDSHIFAKAADGFYVEPAWCSERLFEVEKFPGRVWDPACGWGTITAAALRSGYRVLGTDIIDRKRHKLGRGFFQYDFLSEERISPGGNFSIVCNPPFDHVEEFARQALTRGARKVALIILTRRLNAARWLAELPLKKIWLLTPRPSMPPGEWIAAGNKPGGGTQDFCWLVFDRNYATAEIGWLTRDVVEAADSPREGHGGRLVLRADKTVAGSVG